MAPVEEMAMLDFDRSNKGASKQRRDQINAEIATMRDLLPLPETSRQRLSQLQIMSLTCVYVRKCNILDKLFRTKSQEQLPESADFFQALSGFVLVTTRSGKLLYISENVTDYLGHSMVDMKTQGDSLYDIVDKRDHSTVQAQLLQGVPSTQGSSLHHPANGKGSTHGEDVSFFCRMNMSRTLKRQSGFGDVKVMHVRGHFINVRPAEGECVATESHCVFMATCSPLITPDLKETLVQSNTMVFKTVHKLDMTFIEMTKNGEHHLGCSSEDLAGKSWYTVLHPEDIHQAKEKHVQLIHSSHEIGCMLTLRMLRADGSSFWVNSVLQVRQASLPQSDEAYIVCINQVIDESEAYQIKMQAHMFSFYPSRAHELWGGHLSTMGPSGVGLSQEHISSGHVVSQHWDIPAARTPGYHGGNGVRRASYAYSDQSHMVGNTSHGMMPYGHSVMINHTHQHPQQHAMMRCQRSPQSQGRFQYDMTSQVQPDQLKAMLKRKIQGPQIHQQYNDCKASKIPKIEEPDDSAPHTGPDAGREYTQMGMRATVLGKTHLQNQQLRHTFQFKPHGGDHVVQVMHVSQPRVFAFGQTANLGMKSGLVGDSSTELGKVCVGTEQIVPDVNVPDSYLTPDPSPASSPQPSTSSAATVKIELVDDAFTQEKKGSFNILQALEKLAAMPHQEKPTTPAEMKKSPAPVSTTTPSLAENVGDKLAMKKKGLPIFDAFEIDNFFDTLDQPADKPKVSTRVEQVKIKEEVNTQVAAASLNGITNSDDTLRIKYEVVSPPTCVDSALQPPTPCSFQQQQQHQAKVKQELSHMEPDFKQIVQGVNLEQQLPLGAPVFSMSRCQGVGSHMVESSPLHTASACSPYSSPKGNDIDDLLSYFSDEGTKLSPLHGSESRHLACDNSVTSPDALLDNFDHFQSQRESSHKFCYQEELSPAFSDVSKIVKSDDEGSPHLFPAEFSPTSSTSSLAGEDDLLDERMTFNLDLAFDMFHTSGQKEKVEQISSGQFLLKDRDLGISEELDFILDSLEPSGSLDLIKPGQ